MGDGVDTAGAKDSADLGPPPEPGPFTGLMAALATGLGLGLIPVAPGTFGSLLGPPLVWALRTIPSLPGQIVVSILVVAVGVPICGFGERWFRRRDPGGVVYDEIAAFPIVFAFAPFTWTTAVLGFVLFRLFDIVKPWPVRRLERLPGGWGVLLDDLAAGLQAAIALQIILLSGLPI